MKEIVGEINFNTFLTLCNIFSKISKKLVRKYKQVNPFYSKRFRRKFTGFLENFNAEFSSKFVLPINTYTLFQNLRVVLVQKLGTYTEFKKFVPLAIRLHYIEQTIFTRIFHSILLKLYCKNLIQKYVPTIFTYRLQRTVIKEKEKILNFSIERPQDRNLLDFTRKIYLFCKSYDFLNCRSDNGCFFWIHSKGKRRALVLENIIRIFTLLFINYQILGKYFLQFFFFKFSLEINDFIGAKKWFIKTSLQSE